MAPTEGPRLSPIHPASTSTDQTSLTGSLHGRVTPARRAQCSVGCSPRFFPTTSQHVWDLQQLMLQKHSLQGQSTAIWPLETVNVNDKSVLGAVIRHPSNKV